MTSRSGRWSVTALLGAAVLVLAGCSEIPTSGPVERGEEVRAVVDEPPVRALPRDPVLGQSPEEVVRGFLAASASFENDHEVAKRFLSPEAADQWDTDAGVTVIDDTPAFRLERVPGGVRLRAQQVAQIGADGALVPTPEVDVRRFFTLDRVGESWRITDLPQGLILDRIEVSLAFRAFDIYFMNPQRTFLVPDPVYLPLAQAGSATTLVKSLLDGPTPWLRPAVESMIPIGTELVVDSVPNDNGVARVDLSAEFFDADDIEREQAAAQITATLLGLSSTVTGVTISVDGSPLQLPAVPTVMTRDTWERYDPDTLVPALDAVFVRSGVVRRLSDDGSTPVQGPLGDGRFDVVEPSQSWDGGTITALDRGGRRLLVTRPFLSAGVESRLSGRQLLPASIDAEDRVWAVDVASNRPRVQVLDGDGSWEPVSVRGLRDRLVAFRVSADGTRVAVVTAPGDRDRGDRGRGDRGRGDRGGRGELLLGRVVVRANGYQVEAFRRMERTLVEVRDVSWSDSSSLVALGGTAGSVPEPTLVDVNRSVTALSGAPAVGVRQVTAGPGLPLLADTPDDGIWVDSGSVWVFGAVGRDPAYPG